MEVDADYRFGIEIPESSSSNYPTPIGSVGGNNNVRYYSVTIPNVFFTK